MNKKKKNKTESEEIIEELRRQGYKPRELADYQYSEKSFPKAKQKNK